MYRKARSSPPGNRDARERLGVDVGVQAPEAPEAAHAGAHAAPVGQLDRARVADHHVGHGAPPVDQHPHLTPGLARQAGELARELLGEEAFRWQVASREAFELADLAGLEPVGVPEYADGAALATRGYRRQCT